MRLRCNTSGKLLALRKSERGKRRLAHTHAVEDRLPAVLEEDIVQRDGLIPGLDRVIERDPAFAPRVFGCVGDRVRSTQSAGAQDQEIEWILRAVVETHVDQRAGPDVLVVDRVHLLARLEFDDVGDDCRRGEDDFARLLVALLQIGSRVRLEHVGILVEVGRKEEERAVLEFESADRFEDAPFAEEDDLFASRERVADDRPLFQRHG